MRSMILINIKSSVLRGIAVSALTVAGMSFTMATYALSPFEATYQFTYGSKNMGDATRKLSKTGDNWQYKFSAKIP